MHFSKYCFPTILSWKHLLFQRDDQMMSREYAKAPGLHIFLNQGSASYITVQLR